MKNTEILVADRHNKEISSERQNLYIEAATSDNTRRAYRSDIRHFKAWGGVLPTNVKTVIAYLHDYAETLNPRTLYRRIVAIKNWHVYLGHEDPTSASLVKKTLTGIQNVHGKPKKKAPALSVENLSQIVTYLKTKDEYYSYRDSALLQVGFFGAFRRSELIKIRFDHIRFVPEGVEIIVPKSKADQSSDGSVCALPYGNNTLCPVKALKLWLEKSKIKSGFIFPSFRTETKRFHSVDVLCVNTALKRSAKACKIEGFEKFSGHSLRRGLATSASQNGATLSSIMRQGRWNHQATVLEYIEEGGRFCANAANIILQKTV